MALNIPNVAPFSDTLLKGIDSGSNMFARLMQPIIEREKQKQLASQFAQELALRKQTESRLGANAGLTREILQQNLLKLKHANDPGWELQQYKALEDWVKGQDAAQQRAMQTSIPTQETGQGLGAFTPESLGIPPTQPQEESQNANALLSAQTSPQEMNQGLGMFSPEGLQGGQQPTPPAAVRGTPGGIDLELLKAHPMLRGWAKKHLGYDPLAQVPQTPAEKEAIALDLFNKKLALKGGTTPTNAVLTQNQKAIQGIDSAIPILDELINSKEIPGILTFSPGQKAKYLSKTGSIIDTLVAAQNLPQVQASIDLVEQQIRRHTGETVHDYQQRLTDFKKDLLGRRERAVNNVVNRKINVNPPAVTSTSTAPDGTIKKRGNKTYKVIKGEWHEVH